MRVGKELLCALLLGFYRRYARCFLQPINHWKQRFSFHVTFEDFLSLAFIFEELLNNARMKISIDSISKSYKDQKVLDQISLSIEPGTNFCLLGKNGAGKTTLINCMLDLVKFDEGAITFNDKSIEKHATEIKMSMGVMSEDNPLVDQLTGYGYLRFVGALYKVSGSELEQRIESLTKFFFGDMEVLKKRISSYSTGMKKKLGVIAAVLHKPDLLLLDEPFSGLDPVAAKVLIEFINNYQNGERVVFLSSHDLAYVEKVATRLGVLNDKQIVYENSLAEFTANGKEELDDALIRLLQPENTDLSELSWINQ